jgi:hypothetical protein
MKYIPECTQSTQNVRKFSLISSICKTEEMEPCLLLLMCFSTSVNKQIKFYKTFLTLPYWNLRFVYFFFNLSVTILLGYQTCYDDNEGKIHCLLVILK